MFEINEQNIPFVRTRQALLVIDLQNDFVSTGGLLPVETPPDFLDKIFELIPPFRDSGNDIIWFKSQFEASRPVNGNTADAENVITDQQLLTAHRRSGDKGRPGPSQRLLELQSRIALSNGRAMDLDDDIEAEDEEVDEIEETFFTIPDGRIPRVVVAHSPGANFTHRATMAMDTEKDLVLLKTYYSAFRDGTLVQILRAKFVTELFIVGALTNISVFATAMDAAQHGYAITIVEDGLGYRSKPRHDEALRKLTEFTGCDIVKSEDVIYELQRKGVMQSLPRGRSNPRRRENGATLEGLMANLQLRSDGLSHTRPPPRSKPPMNGAAQNGQNGQNESGSSESLAPGESPPEKSTETNGHKRERVKTKLKTRTRRSKSTSSEKKPGSPTTVTLLGVSQALEKIPIPLREVEEVQAATSEPEATSEVPSTVYTERPRAEVAHSGAMKNKSERLDRPVSNREEYIKSDPDSSTFCEADTTVIRDLLGSDVADEIFEKLRDEVEWQKMSHQGGDVPRLVAVQGKVDEDGSMPVYRHPSDEAPPLRPFSPTVSMIQGKVEQALGHSVNHVLIQFYRSGMDYISEHSDKTLDIVKDTYIANVSLGAQRTMIFRTKRPPKKSGEPETSEPPLPRQSCRIPLPHNSLCKVGLATNMRWLHSIRQDKRMQSEKSAEEVAYDGGRISLTFRKIGTFLNKSETKIWGQGAVSKCKNHARTVINGETADSEAMLKAFGTENQATEFDWAAHYGSGFDVLHISNSPKLCLSGDPLQDTRAKIALAWWKIPWVEGKSSPLFKWKENESNNGEPIPSERLPVRYVDNDVSRSTVTGDHAVIVYLDSVYAEELAARTRSDLARQMTRFQQTAELLKKWRAEPFSIKPFKKELECWDAYAAEASYIAGSVMSPADFSVWPILHEISKEWDDFGGNENLLKYYEFMKEMDCVIEGAGLEKNKSVEEKEKPAEGKSA